jgi:hypothetical protein
MVCILFFHPVTGRRAHPSGCRLWVRYWNERTWLRPCSYAYAAIGNDAGRSCTIPARSQASAITGA